MYQGNRLIQDRKTFRTVSMGWPNNGMSMEAYMLESVRTTTGLRGKSMSCKEMALTRSLRSNMMMMRRK